MNFPRKSLDYAGHKWFVNNHCRCCRYNKCYDIIFGHRTFYTVESGLDFCAYEYITYISDMEGKVVETRIGSSFIDVNDRYFNAILEYA